MSDAPREVDLLEQTLYLARKIFDDPNAPPSPLDLHSACAIGSYDCVYDAITAGRDINRRNKCTLTSKWIFVRFVVQTPPKIMS